MQTHIEKKNIYHHNILVLKAEATLCIHPLTDELHLMPDVRPASSSSVALTRRYNCFFTP